MEAIPGYSEISGKREIDIIETVLKSGNSVELPASGYSMFPTLKPGDRVVIKPAIKGIPPDPGTIVVIIDHGTTGSVNSVKLVLHRLIGETTDDHNNPLLITRGDAMAEADKPWPLLNLLGVAEYYKRRTREYVLKSFLPAAWKYKLNYFLMWSHNQVMRIRKRFDGTMV